MYKDVEELTGVTTYSPTASDYARVISQAISKWGNLRMIIDSGNMIRSCKKVGNEIIIR